MSRALESRAQVIRLARLLRTEPEALAGLEGVDPADLRALRGQVADALLTAHRTPLQRAATMAGLLPPALAAQIAEHVLGPLLSARAAGLLSPRHARAMLEHLSPGFLAEVAVEVEPRHARDVIALVPADLVAEIATHLDRRAEYVTMADFTEHLEGDALEAAVGALSDEGLIHTGFVVEDKARLDTILALLDDRRVKKIVAVVGRRRLWTEALDLVAQVGPEQRTRLARHIGALPDRDIDGLLAALADDPELAASVRTLATEVPADQRLRALLAPG